MKSSEYNFYNYKRINDPVHGTIGLSELEVLIINTNAFQRLRNVKQLGLANFVFPGADFTRFSHSLGVCHLTGKIFETLSKNKILSISEEDLRDLRIAALLHDIGHYPFSHTMEDAIEDFYGSETEDAASKLYVKKTQETNGLHSVAENTKKDVKNYFAHDSVGREILSNDNQLTKIFNNYNIHPEEIYSIFTRDNAPKFANIVSSDLDADRIDYLRRSSYSVGLPYGSVDINYLISQISIDDQQNLCINSKALRTVDHFLLSRYFEYSQVIYHKTVAAFELVLTELISYLLQNNKISDCSSDGVITSIKSGFWYSFDDQYIFTKIRELITDKSAPDSIREKARSIIERRAPKELIKIEYIANRDERTKKEFENKKHQLMKLKPELAKKFSIEEEYWAIWNNHGIELTKVGTSVEYSKITQGPQKETKKDEQTIRIKNERTHECKRIMECDNSLMNILADQCLYTIRLYLLYPCQLTKRRKTQYE